MANSTPLLSVNLRVDYPKRPCTLKAVCFDINAGEVLGLVGESGSGKSTIALAILRLLSFKGGQAQGQILFRGSDLLAVPEREMKTIRGREIGLILQSPTSSLNPALRIGTQLAEAWRSHSKNRRQQDIAVEDSLARVGLPTDREFRSRYPSQISAGQAQRVLIAMAMMHSPSLLIADEPTSSLDVITQWEILRLFSALNRRTGSALLYISHDLISVASICHRIAILRDGEIVECGETESLLTRPRHPYTEQLLGCLPWLSAMSVPQALPNVLNQLTARGSSVMPGAATDEVTRRA